MATLAVKGAVYNSCYSDHIAYQYGQATAGDLGGSCGSVLAACSRWKQLEYVDLTPATAGDFTTIQKHIRQYYAVVAEIVVGRQILKPVAVPDGSGAGVKGLLMASHGGGIKSFSSIRNGSSNAYYRACGSILMFGVAPAFFPAALAS